MNIKNGMLLYLLSMQSLLVYADGLFYGRSESMGDEAFISASKYEEEIFKAPLSMSIVNSKQLKNAGVTTLAEAMKLVPGVVVRETTNGQYEVHIRGFDSIVNKGDLSGLTNKKVLIMIDNRLVFDYFNSTLFWETLPIGVEDVDRIEVVRGASSALYGTNAVNGVIHFITKRAKSKQAVSASLIAGNKNTTLIQAAVEKKVSGTSFRLSGRSEKRNRYEDKYFSFKTRKYESPENITFSTQQNEGVDSNNAKDIQSFMLTINNDSTEYFTYDIGYFHEESEVQKIFIASRDIPFTTGKSYSDAINANINYGDLSTRFSYHWGEQATNGLSDFKYDVAIGQATIEYQYQLPQWIIRPGLHINHVTYDGPFIGGTRSLIEKKYLLRTEYFPSSTWRVIAALSYDDYNAPSKNYLSYQFLTTYQPRFDLLFRAGLQTANMSSNIVNQYIDVSFEFSNLDNGPRQITNVTGNKESKLSKIESFELGARYQIRTNQLLDFEIFYSQLKDISVQTNKGTVFFDNTYTTTLEFETLPSVAAQTGMTIDWRLENLTWDMSAYLTWQKTYVFDQVEAVELPFVTSNENHKVIPELYGGFTLDLRFKDNINLNIQSYYLGSHEINLTNPQGNYKARGAMNTNLTLSYRYNKNLSGFLAVKNLSSNQSQSFYSDRLEPIYMLGTTLLF